MPLASVLKSLRSRVAASRCAAEFVLELAFEPSFVRTLPPRAHVRGLATNYEMPLPFALNRANRDAVAQCQDLGPKFARDPMNFWPHARPQRGAH